MASRVFVVSVGGWLIWCWRGAKLEGNKFKHDVKSTLGFSTFRTFTYLVLHLVSTLCIRSDVTSSQHRQTLLQTWPALVAWKACTLVIERNSYFPYIVYEIWLYFISIPYRRHFAPDSVSFCSMEAVYTGRRDTLQDQGQHIP